VLACSLPSADMVLVPRLPTTAALDGLYFLAYATNLRAVELCERLRQQKQVALVLDLGERLAGARVLQAVGAGCNRRVGGGGHASASWALWFASRYSASEKGHGSAWRGSATCASRCWLLLASDSIPIPLCADNTLVDAVSCTIAPNDWPLLEWRHVTVTNSYGRAIQAQYAPLPGQDAFSGGCSAGPLAFNPVNLPLQWHSTTSVLAGCLPACWN
jgi:hypothetical protein